MSRVGKQPVVLPSGVTVEMEGERGLRVKGPKGELRMTLRPEVEAELEGKEVRVSRKEETRQGRAYHGMTRALIQNMVQGVTQGYQKELEIHGVGWNVAVQGRQVVLNIGFCNPVKLDIPEGVQVQTPTNTLLAVSGIDKQAVGQLAARIRAARPPEPYKGKGVRYRGEFVRQKAGKSFGS